MTIFKIKHKITIGQQNIQLGPLTSGQLNKLNRDQADSFYRKIECSGI